MRRPGSRFELSDEQWRAAADQVREAILDAAYDRRMTWYGEIADRVSAVELDPHSPLMNALLGAVFEQEHDAGRPALTSIVTHKYGDKEPGRGFYDKARALGYRFNEPYIFWAQQVQAVFKAHGKSALGAPRMHDNAVPRSVPNYVMARWTTSEHAHRCMNMRTSDALNSVRAGSVGTQPHAVAWAPGPEVI